MTDYPGRYDSDVYRQLPGTDGHSPDDWALKNENHPYRGRRARQRWVDALKDRPGEAARKAKSGLSWDAYVERRHRLKDMCASALILKRFALPGLMNPVSLQEPLGNTLRSLTRARLPLVINTVS